MKRKPEQFRAIEYVIFSLVTAAVLCACVCIGSVNIPLKDTVTVIWNAITRQPQPAGLATSIILSVRLPRVLCVALSGTALSLAGAAMQGLLKNPLADGSTLGVSSGASLGAVLAIAFGLTFPALPVAGTMLMAILFAFLSLLIILGLAYKLDYSLSTNTIILIGVIYSMFVSSAMNVIITFSAERVKDITFWTMGSLQNSSYLNAVILAGVLLVCGGIIVIHARELNAFAVGEDNARHVGVDVRRTKLVILITVSILIGVCVSVGGTIGFVGLVIPHISRTIIGTVHRRLIPFAALLGGILMIWADAVARVVVAPSELPIGIVTAFIGAPFFLFLLRGSKYSFQ